MRYVLALLPRLWANLITLFGAVLATVAGVSIVILFALELALPAGNAYTSSFLIVTLPFIFVTGLLLIPFGLWIDRRRLRKLAKRTGQHPADLEPDAVQKAFTTALQDPSARMRILFVGVISIFNIFLFGFAGHKAVTYMDSPKFCGTTCHSVMQPEWEAYNRSPHSRVECVQCHIGPGTTWLVKSKINGLSQVWGVLTGKYHRPVPTPVEHLRPSRDTCEQCHWPAKFAGSQLRLLPHYKDDEKNSPIFNALLVRIGGENPRTKKYEGIHWHVNTDNEVRYEYLDRERTKIGKITVLVKGKVTEVFDVPGQKQAALGARTMDCVDCHNRPTHIYDVTPKNAIDKALYAGALDVKTPYIAKVAAGLLERKDVPQDGMDDWFKQQLTAEYGKSYPTVKLDGKAVDGTAATLGAIYRRNVYPKMNVGWNTYRSNLGHHADGVENWGCFRCHDKVHEAKLADGTTKTMSQDCDSCHDRLAIDEDPSKLDETIQALLPRTD